MIINTIEEEVVQQEAEAVAEPLEQEVALPKKKKSKPAKKKEEPAADDADDIGAMILSWKAEYKKIFKNEIDGEVIIWRRLKRGEYKEILTHEEEDEDSRILTKQEMMVRAAVLYPFDVDTLIEENAGVATLLSEEILAKSGFAMSYTEEL